MNRLNTVLLSSVAVLGMSSVAEAAGLQGFVNIAPDVGGVIITEGDGVFSDFDFDPGTIVETGSNPLLGENDFSVFVGQQGNILDITAATIQDVNSGNPLDNFLLFEDSFSFRLEEVSVPVFTETPFGTTGFLSAQGTFFNLSDGSNSESEGLLNFSSDFVSFTLEETVELVTSENNFVASWSLNALATAEEEPKDVPEPTMALTLLFGGVLTALKRRLSN